MTFCYFPMLKLFKKLILSNQAEIVGLVFLSLILIILPWLFLGYLSVLINILSIIALLIYISYSYDVTIPILGAILHRCYLKVKFKLEAVNKQAEILKKAKKISHKLKLKIYKIILAILHHSILLFKSSADSFAVLKEELQKLHGHKLYINHKAGANSPNEKLTIDKLAEKIKKGETISPKAIEKLDNLFYKLHNKKQKRVSAFSLLSLSVLIAGTIITGLITSLVFPNIFSSKAATFNWAQTSWLGGASALTASHASDQTGWTKYSSGNNGIATSTDLKLKTLTATTSIDFTTEGNYTQQDAANGTDFSSGTVNLHDGSINATGGTITYSGGYTIHTFTTDGTFTPAISGNVETLVVGGGGGGAGSGSNIGGAGGGGAGGYIYNSSFAVDGQAYSITVGAGGAGGAAGSVAGTNGSDSIFSTLTAVGGGGGGSYTNAPKSGGSGGGANFGKSNQGSGTSGQGHSGGSGGPVYTPPYDAGGGGGASADGAYAGGDGSPNSISGAPLTYAGGGGGGSTNLYSGGAGGGGNGGSFDVNGANGTANLGGGGGGGGNTSSAGKAGGAGGAGVVIVKYQTSARSTTESYYVTTAAASQLNTSTYAHISSVALAETTPANTSIKYLVSFDNRSNWKYWDGDSWETTTLSNANLQSYGMASSTVAAITQSQWETSGGFTPGTTATLDFAADLKTTDASATPSLDNISVNYQYYPVTATSGSSNVDFNTEGNYTQQDATDGTDFESGATTLTERFDWTQRTLPASPSWYSVAYGNGVFVAVAETSNIAASSPDGITWTQRAMPVSGNWVAVTYGNGMFVAVNDTTPIAASSPDGITWTQRAMPVSARWRSVAYGNGMFVALDYNNSSIAASSPDGITWTQRTLPATANWYAVAYGNGVFAAVANGSSIAATSSNGITWTQRTLPASTGWVGIAYGNGVFVTAAYGSSIAATSPDGATWTQRTLPVNTNWRSVGYGNGMFVAVVYTSDIAATSPDGSTWTQRTLPATVNWDAVAYGNGVFVAVANGSSIAATSPCSPYPTSTSYYVTTDTASQLNTSTYAHISSVALTETTPTNTSIKYLVSFDNRSTWKYWDGDSWETTTLSNANLQSYGRTKTQIEAITQTQWETSGGFIGGTTATLDFAADLKTTDSAVTPSLDNILVNYVFLPAALISSAYDTSSDANALGGVNWTQDSTLPTGTGIKIYLRASSTAELLATTDWAEVASTTAAGYITSGCTNTSGAIACDATIIPALMKDGVGDRWIQYKVELTTSVGSNTPTLSDITVIYVVNGAPEVRQVTASQGLDGKVTVEYQMRDADTDTATLANRYKATVTLQYCTADCSDAGNETWANAAAVTGSGQGADLAIATSWSATSTISWTPATDYNNQYNAADFKVRVKVYDKEGANNLGYGESAIFILDTTAPALGAHPILASATTTPATLTLSATDNSALYMKISLNSDLSGATAVAYAATSSINLADEPDIVYVQFIDAYNNATAIQSATLPNKTASTMVQDISNLSSSEFRLFLAWGVASEPFSQYQIYRSTDNSAFSLLATVDVKATNYYTDATAAQNTLYYYRVAVKDTGGNVSSLSSAISAKANGAQDFGEGGGGTATVPTISNADKINISTAQATITWDTDLLSNSQVLYQTSTGGNFSTAPMVGVASMANTAAGVGAHSVTLTGLTPATTYYFLLKSTDANDNTASSTSGVNGYTFDTLSGPVISAVATSSISNTAATITWTTTEASDSGVFYSTSASLANPIEISKSSDSTTSHTINLTGLTMGTNYYFYVKSGVASDNHSGNYYNFMTTIDITPPDITGIAAIASTTMATITWTTNELASTKVQYGLTTDYGAESSSDLLTLDHVRALTDLTDGSTYHYRVISMDANNNSATSTDSTFNSYTTVLADTTAPTITNVSASPVYDTVAVITWETNELADSTVQYGLANTLGTTQTAATSTKLHSLSLTGLTADTIYYYKVLSADSSTNSASSSISTFTTQETLTQETDVLAREATARAEGAAAPTTGGGIVYVTSSGSTIDRTPPVISGIDISGIKDDSATVSWKTDKSADSFVKYGINNILNKKYGDFEMATNHYAVLDNLLPSSTYYFLVASRDANGNLAQSASQTFKTSSILAKLDVEAQKVKEIELLANAQGKENVIASAAQTAMDIISEAAKQVSITSLESTLNNQYDFIEKLAASIPAPLLSGEPRVITTAYTATVAWRTNKESNSLVAYSPEDNFKASSAGDSFSQVIGDAEAKTTNHVVDINELKPDTTYIYQVRSKPPIGPSAQSSNFTFHTQKEALEISSYVVQNVSNEKAIFKWMTNIDTDAMLKYIPYRNNVLAVDQAKAKTDKTFSLIHEITLDDLEAGTIYQVELSGKDKKNDKISKVIPTFITSNDDLPPIIYQVQSSSAINQGKTDTIQTVISWMTNEPSTSKVYYIKGLGKESDLFSSSSQLDLNYTKKHITIITKLEPGSIYRFMVESTDSTNNTTLSKVYTILTPRKQETVFDVIKKNFVDVFGWTSQVGK